jgi:hypothetical protein
MVGVTYVAHSDDACICRMLMYAWTRTVVYACKDCIYVYTHTCTFRYPHHIHNTHCMSMCKKNCKFSRGMRTYVFAVCAFAPHIHVCALHHTYIQTKQENMHSWRMYMHIRA